MEIISRVKAKELGLTRYFTGKPCKYGHIATRTTKSATCGECLKLSGRAKYQEAEVKERYQQMYQENREHKLAIQKIADAARGEEKLEYGRQWRAENADYAENYRKENAALYAFHAAQRRALKKMATPGWSETEEIKALYKQAEEQGLEVDHIVPLKHPLVCGLHCLANLQLLPEAENRSKHNTFLVE
ncbi:hypothetical protein D3C75_879980 [compost metagenome]